MQRTQPFVNIDQHILAPCGARRHTRLQWPAGSFIRALPTLLVELASSRPVTGNHEHTCTFTIASNPALSLYVAAIKLDSMWLQQVRRQSTNPYRRPNIGTRVTAAALRFDSPDFPIYPNGLDGTTPSLTGTRTAVEPRTIPNRVLQILDMQTPAHQLVRPALSRASTACLSILARQPPPASRRNLVMPPRCVTSKYGFQV